MLTLLGAQARLATGPVAARGQSRGSSASMEEASAGPDDRVALVRRGCARALGGKAEPEEVCVLSRRI